MKKSNKSNLNGQTKLKPKQWKNKTIKDPKLIKKERYILLFGTED